MGSLPLGGASVEPVPNEIHTRTRLGFPSRRARATVAQRRLRTVLELCSLVLLIARWYREVTHPQSIQRVRYLLDGPRVPGFDHCWSLDENGNRWVRKRELHVGFTTIAAEVIGWHLSQCLAVPVPDAAIYEEDPNEDGSTSFLSKEILPVVHWNSDKYMNVRNLKDLGRILTLDTLILNEDRNPTNLLLQQVPDELNLRLWAIDAGNALVGVAPDFRKRAGDIPRPIRSLHLPIDLLRASAMEAAAQAAALPRTHLGWIVMDAIAVTKISELEPLADILENRCKRAPDLVSRYLSALSR